MDGTKGKPSSFIGINNAVKDFAAAEWGSGGAFFPSSCWGFPAEKNK